MPIVFVHGVATREPGFEATWADLERYLRHYVAPQVSADDPGAVDIRAARWGGLASKLRFGGISRPLSPLLGQGAEEEAGPRVPVEIVDLLPVAPPEPDGAGDLLAAGPARAPVARPVRELGPDDLSDFAVACAYRADTAPAIEWLVAADEAAHDPGVLDALRRARDDRTALEIYENAVARRLDTDLAGMGAGSALREWFRWMTEAADRLGRTPGFVASRVLGEARRPVNELAVRFIGDVLVYVDSREGENGSGLGEIPGVVLNALREADERRLSADEPMVVVTHSMGGQIVYDLVTHFLPAQGGPRIDFWCATASQVGLFLELNLFAAKDNGEPPLRGPDPRWLGGWWNVWDYNDFLSFSADGIVSGVDDEAYSSGLSLIGAHSGYLRRPSFYRRLRAKLGEARERNWDRA